jgi:3-hydroxybutyryl-CoA dehydrogenase
VFIVNHILLPMINEAIYTLYEGVGNVEAIDAAMKLGAHHPMGPLERRFHRVGVWQDWRYSVH